MAFENELIQSYFAYQVIGMILSFIFLIVLVFFIVSFISKTKSQKARSFISDLYVIGMIRQFAEKDGIDLEKEVKQIRKMDRLENMSTKNLDEVIEQELKQKISAENQKKFEEIEKKSEKISP